MTDIFLGLHDGRTQPFIKDSNIQLLGNDIVFLAMK